MSVARCTGCQGLLPPWLQASADPAHARCPNCGHINDLTAARTPPPQPNPSLKSTNTYATLDARNAGGQKAPSFNKTMLMGSAPPIPPATREDSGEKSPALAKTMILGAARPAMPTQAPATTAPPPQRRVATLPQLAPVVVETAPAPPQAGARDTHEDVDALPDDSSVALDTPPSRTSLPSWVVPGAIDDAPTGPVVTANPIVAILGSRKGKLAAAAAGGVVVIVLAIVFLAGGRKSDAPVAVTRPAPVTAPMPEPVKPVAEPAAVVAEAIKPAAEPEKPAPRPRPVAAIPAPRPVAAPVAKPAPVARPVASVRPSVATRPITATPTRAGGIPALPSEDDQRLAREAYARGNAQLFQGQVPQATASFKESLKLDPRNPAAQRGLGLAYGQAGNAKEAVAYLKRYLKASPTASDRAVIEKRIEQLSAR